ncbi:MAG TPA: AAA family ATPase [Thermoanaerobaculia bacterium]|nr:AAA family ATPase [Thermoanaerobaculia bacterium]
MKLKRLEIHNYKSLRNVVLEPAPLSVFVGPNAAGKSNFADALDFLSEVYRWDLEGAVKKKGGYENICFRQAARSTEAIRFRVVLEFLATDWDSGFKGTYPVLFVDHTFELGVKSRSPRAPFFVNFEELVVREEYGEGSLVLSRVTRKRGKIAVDLGDTPEGSEPLRANDPLVFAMKRLVREPIDRLSDVELLIPRADTVYRWGGLSSRLMSGLRVFQLSPHLCRSSGVPTPNSNLERFGGNLPAVVDFLRREHPTAFDRLLDTIRRVMPSIEMIETNFTHTKTLGLFLKEVGVAKPWTAEDISDGTIQAIALLTATFDPRVPILVIEEPENSVHPWAIRNFVQAFREASETKQIFLTTHSPILIDQIRPEELWVVQRPELETKITPVLELDPSLKDAWGQGKSTLSEYLDSGAIPAAVPASGV